MFYFDEDHMENGFNEPGGTDKRTSSSIRTSSSNEPRMPPRFQDHYQLVDDNLGTGAYACVRTAISTSTGEEFAVKLVDKNEPGHTHSRILREVEIFEMCRDHPNIVQLIEWFEDDEYCYMVFEKMRGGPLLNRIQQRVCFTEQEASQVTREIASALKFLHDKGVAHRDVKPENILCTYPDRVSPVKLCDLDLASKPMNASPCGSSLSGGVSAGGLHMVQSEPNLASPVGSAEFMAPEVVDAFVADHIFQGDICPQARRDRHLYDKRCDMWSLGVIVYIMLCGYTPFYGECERENCGWDQGKPCPDCQDNLFHRIQRGEFEFPEEEWTNISSEAKDLINHLLVRNVRLRYTAADVLNHKWVVNDAPNTLLQTPSNLFRNDSARNIHQLNEHFNVINRLTSGRVSSQRLQIDTNSNSSGVSKATGQDSGNGSSNTSTPLSSPQIALGGQTRKRNPLCAIDELSHKMRTSAISDGFDLEGTIHRRTPVTPFAQQVKPLAPLPPHLISPYLFSQQQPEFAPLAQSAYPQNPPRLNNGVLYCYPNHAVCSYPVMMVNHPVYTSNMMTLMRQQQQPMYFAPVCFYPPTAVSAPADVNTANA